MIAVASRILATILCLFFCLVGCKRRPTETSELPLPQTSIDACTLLKGDEIEAVQGSPVKESKSSANANSGLRVAQCFYSAAEFSKSVVINVTQRDREHPTARTANEFWNTTFGEGARENRERESEHEEEKEEKASSPKKIEGLGDEAYWTGARFGGALYVLKREKDAFIRISVGGGDTEESKIEKSKALARKALGRL
jgi:hypothetical protein